MEIKICGLTRPKEAEYLNEAGVNYAGFVFFEKSRRNVSLEQARAVSGELLPSIRRVAVTVSPDEAQVRRLQDTGFDILQVHGNLTPEALEAAAIPVWYACNIQEEAQLEKAVRFLQELPQALSDKITGLVVDGAEYGSGRPFNWRRSKLLQWNPAKQDSSAARSRPVSARASAHPPDARDGTFSDRDGNAADVARMARAFWNRSFVLAGGLNADNVAEGIRMFHPDVVDVSSGVEGADGKDRARIEAFVRATRSEAELVPLRTTRSEAELVPLRTTRSWSQKGRDDGGLELK